MEYLHLKLRIDREREINPVVASVTFVGIMMRDILSEVS